MGFIHTPELMARLEDTPALRDLYPAAFDALVVCGGQGPMFQFREHVDLKSAIAAFYEAENPPRTTNCLAMLPFTRDEARLRDLAAEARSASPTR